MTALQYNKRMTLKKGRGDLAFFAVSIIGFLYGIRGSDEMKPFFVDYKTVPWKFLASHNLNLPGWGDT